MAVDDGYGAWSLAGKRHLEFCSSIFPFFLFSSSMAEKEGAISTHFQERRSYRVYILRRKDRPYICIERHNTHTSVSEA
ncbi:hypothetical protein E4T47_05598 [Aureobasidium subglaciale]|nr:hypothetical protein E4T47_05598 [Aureobasidium subglaciale]